MGCDSVILHASYPPDIRTYCREIPENEIGRQQIISSAEARIAILDAIEPIAGPDKWIRLNHDVLLSFFAFDPNEFARQSPQVSVECRKRYSRISYLLPREHRPWETAQAVAFDVSEAVELVLDAFTRCELRREYLIEQP
jgi:hypothetical protein